jgi:hypothetical protein
LDKLRINDKLEIDVSSITPKELRTKREVLGLKSMPPRDSCLVELEEIQRAGWVKYLSLKLITWHKE